MFQLPQRVLGLLAPGVEHAVNIMLCSLLVILVLQQLLCHGCLHGQLYDTFTCLKSSASYIILSFRGLLQCVLLVEATLQLHRAAVLVQTFVGSPAMAKARRRADGIRDRPNHLNLYF